MQINIPTVHILEINCYIVKSNKLSTILACCTKNYRVAKAKLT